MTRLRSSPGWNGFEMNAVAANSATSRLRIWEDAADITITGMSAEASSSRSECSKVRPSPSGRKRSRRISAGRWDVDRKRSPSPSEEKRTILSRDKDLLKHGRVTHGYWVRATDPPAQFREIVDAFDLRRNFQPFSRCMECNGQLRVADETEVLDRIPFAVLVAYDEFWQCEECRKIYWKGSHYTQLARLIETV